jgi:(2Fe-2S) ferredoxin
MKPTRCVFVCVNARDGSDPKGSCHEKFAPMLLQKFGAELDARGIGGEVKLIPSGCLGPCSEGVTICVMPDNVWYGKVKPLDVAEILDKHVLAGDKAVKITRLELPDEVLD